MNDAGKPELHPYESPREPGPLTTGQLVKHAIGVAVVLLLTPPPMIIAVFCCCSVEPWIQSDLAAWIVFGGPFVVLTGLMTTAAVLDHLAANKAMVSPSRTACFIATPFAVSGATVIGFFLGAITYPLGVGMLVAFFAPPSLVLLCMLWLAWRAGDHAVPVESKKTAIRDRGFND